MLLAGEDADVIVSVRQDQAQVAPGRMIPSPGTGRRPYNHEGRFQGHPAGPT